MHDESLQIMEEIFLPVSCANVIITEKLKIRIPISYFFSKTPF